MRYASFLTYSAGQATDGAGRSLIEALLVERSQGLGECDQSLIDIGGGKMAEPRERRDYGAKLRPIYKWIVAKTGHAMMVNRSMVNRSAPELLPPGLYLKSRVQGATPRSGAASGRTEQTNINP